MKITIKKKYIVPGIIGVVVLIIGGAFFKGDFFESWTTSEKCFEFNAGTQTITAYNFENKRCGTMVEIPSKIGGVEVKRIGEGAFAFIFLNENLAKKMQDALNNLDKNNQKAVEEFKKSFKTIQAVKIPNTVTWIGDRAFLFNDINSIDIPNSVIEIGDRAFMYNKLNSITISNSVIEIGELAFLGNNLTSITIPESVTKIGNGAFVFNNLNSIIIPDSVYKSTNLIFKNGIVYKENEDNALTLKYNANRNNTKITIPGMVNGKRVTEIGGNAFANSNLTSIVIPHSVTEIRYNAFKNNNLTSVTIPSSVTEIGLWAFDDDVKIIRK